MAAIHDAARDNDVVRLKQLVQEAPSLISSCDEDGRTPLLVAARNGRIEAAALLIEAGADVNVAQRLYHSGKDLGSSMGITPLHYAANFKHEAVVRLLLEHGADVNATTSDGQTPLKWGKDRMGPEIRQMLIAEGGQPASSGCAGGFILLAVGMSGAVLAAARLLS